MSDTHNDLISIGVNAALTSTATPPSAAAISVAGALTIGASTSNFLYLTASYAVTLPKAFVNKTGVEVASTAAYTIVVPSGVTLWYKGTSFTAITKTVPAGYVMRLCQASATVWFLDGSATLT